MLRLSVLCPLALLAAAAVAEARPQTGATWGGHAAAGSVARAALSAEQQFVAPPFQSGFRPVVRQGRRIAQPDDTATNLLGTTTTTPAPNGDDTGKKLVTLRPIGNNIQEILYNNGYRKTPGAAQPPSNNIDDFEQLDGIPPEDVWLLDDDLLVLKGGSLKEGFIDTTPIDDYEAPYREPKFPPPGFNPQGVLPPGSAGAFVTDGRGHFSRLPQRQQEAFIPEFGYNPYGTRAARAGVSGFGETAKAGFGGGGAGGVPQLGYRAVLPPAGFTFGGTTATPPQPTPAPAVSRHAHNNFLQQGLGGLAEALQKPASRFITNFDSLPRSFVSGVQYPALAASAQAEHRVQPSPSRLISSAAPAGTLFGRHGDYMTYTNHDGGFSYSYKSDGL